MKKLRNSIIAVILAFMMLVPFAGFQSVALAADEVPAATETAVDETDLAPASNDTKIVEPEEDVPADALAVPDAADAGDAVIDGAAADDGQTAVNEPLAEETAPAAVAPKAASGLQGEAKGDGDPAPKSGTSLEEVLAAIGELSNDPRDFTAADKDS